MEYYAMTFRSNSIIKCPARLIINCIWISLTPPYKLHMWLNMLYEAYDFQCSWKYQRWPNMICIWIQIVVRPVSTLFQAVNMNTTDLGYTHTISHDLLLSNSLIDRHGVRYKYRLGNVGNIHICGKMRCSILRENRSILLFLCLLCPRGIVFYLYHWYLPGHFINATRNQL